MRSSCAPPEIETIVLLASLKSVSSVAAQNTGATGTPVASWSESATASALSALDSVYIGPPKRPGCWPVVTTTPRPALDASSLSLALPVASKAGDSLASQSLGKSDRTDSTRSRHDAASVGTGSYQPGGAFPEITAAASGLPASGWVTIRGFIGGSRKVSCGASSRTSQHRCNRQTVSTRRIPRR